MSFGNKGPFPQAGTHTKHKPTGEKPGFIKRSEHTDAGHQDAFERPGMDEIPTEGQGFFQGGKKTPFGG